MNQRFSNPKILQNSPTHRTVKKRIENLRAKLYGRLSQNQWPRKLSFFCRPKFLVYPKPVIPTEPKKTTLQLRKISAALMSITKGTPLQVLIKNFGLTKSQIKNTIHQVKTNFQECLRPKFPAGRPSFKWPMSYLKRFKEIFQRPVHPAPTFQEAWLKMRDDARYQELKNVSYSSFYKQFRPYLEVDLGGGDWALGKRNCDFLKRYRWAYVDRIATHLENDRIP
jgi:hypothetical protein